MTSLTGAMTALITPFKNGKIDEIAYAKLIKRQIASGIDVVVPAGTTGESATMTHEEHHKCIEIAVDICNNTSVKVLAGAGSNATHESISLAQFAQKAGADGILVVTPYYNKPTPEGLYQHYKAIAQAVDIDVMLYNVPGRTGVDLQPITVQRLVNDCQNITAIKEASGNMSRCIELSSMLPQLSIISGDDSLNYPIMANKGAGTISVTANLLPSSIARIIHSVQNNDYAQACEINNALSEMNKVLFIESNPIPIKAIMYLAGLLDTLEYRLPLCPPTQETLSKLEVALKNLSSLGIKVDD